MKEIIQKNEVAHFTNDFALNAQIGFTDARQLLVFLAIVSQTNPQNTTEAMTGILNVKDIGNLTKKDITTKSGSIYKEVGELIEKMMQRNYVQFTPSVDDKDAKKHLKDYGVIFDRLRVVRGGTETFYEYRIHEDMRPHIKELKRDFVSLSLPKGMRSGHAIRFLIMAKAHHDRLRQYKKTSVLRTAVTDLKHILGIEDKYSLFSDFRKWVLEQIVSDINTSGLLHIQKYDFVRTGRKISHIEFFIQDGTFSTPQILDTSSEASIETSENKNDFDPSETDLAKLTRSQSFAYQYLVDKKCKAGIVYRQIIQKLPSSEYLGWEDVFIQKAWERFEKATKYTQANAKAGAFVKWWQNGEFKNRLFSEIMEEVVAEKKQKRQVELDNRTMASRMTNAEFEAKILELRNKSE